MDDRKQPPAPHEDPETLARLRESQHLLEEIVEHIPVMVFVKRASDLRFVLFNRAGEQMLGYSRHDLLGRGNDEFWPKEQADWFTAADRKVLASNEVKEIPEEAIQTASGETRYLHTWKVALRDAAGEPTHMLGISVDITERRASEEKLKQTQSNLAAAQSLAHIGSWEWDVKDNSAQWSDETYRIFGIDRLDLHEHRQNFLDLILPDDRAAVDKALSDALDDTRNYDLEYSIRLPCGSSKTIHALAEVVRDEAGKPTIMRGTVQDITAQKESEQKIRFLSQIYSALSQTNQALIESADEQTLFERICHIVVESGGMKLAWVGVHDGRDGLIARVAVYGERSDYLDGITISSRADVPEGRGPSGVAFRENRSIFIQELKVEPMLAHWRDRVIQYGWGSSGSVPILRGGRSYAVLTFYHTREHIFTKEIIALMSEMSVNIGRGLDRFDLEREKQKSIESMQLAATIYRSSVEAIMVTDENNLVLDVNPAFTQITGYTLEEVKGKNPKMLKSGRHDRKFYDEMWQTLLETGHWQGEIWDRKKDGQLHVKWANLSIIRNPDGGIFRHVAQFFDITDKKEKEELIWRQANFDALTNLPNRQMLLDRLDQEIKKAHRAKAPLALLFIDLDRFKEINDTLGHAKGDRLLVEAARRIRQCVRDTDTVARLGGDEFTVVLPGFGSRSHLEHIAGDIIQKLVEPFDLNDDDTGYISASIGITVYPDDAEDIESLLRHADQAMYEAKAEGRNRFGYFTASMQQEANEKLALTNDLRQALARGELHVYYQPILELGSRRITKAEALLRWKHPGRGMVGPAVFIPLAEESGLIHEIGDWVFRQAIRDVKKWLEQTGHAIQASVNKSPAQFERAGDADWSDSLAELGLPKNSITVEITEGLLLKSDKAKQRLLDYRNKGIEVSIDDFGTGFSSLSYLKQFDIDYLKIDRSFVKDLTTNDSDLALTEAIIVMAHKLGIKTIAEGVETEQQRDLLESFGCDYMQGFLYSPAVPAKEFGRMLAEQGRLPLQR
jgi:diguanylate cyclase (GGDEF)-like protein/PAS domain S-box-containing protein